MEELKKGLKEGKLIIGTKRTIKSVRKDEVSKVFLANNCPEMIKEDILHYCKITDIPVETLSFDCGELGNVCKKPFYVSVVGISKV